MADSVRNLCRTGSGVHVLGQEDRFRDLLERPVHGKALRLHSPQCLSFRNVVTSHEHGSSAPYETPRLDVLRKRVAFAFDRQQFPRYRATATSIAGCSSSRLNGLTR